MSYIHQPRIIALEIMLSSDLDVEEKANCGIQSGLHCLLRYLNRNIPHFIEIMNSSPLKYVILYLFNMYDIMHQNR